MMERCKSVLTVASDLRYWMQMPLAGRRKQESPVSLNRAPPEADTPVASL